MESYYTGLLKHYFHCTTTTPRNVYLQDILFYAFEFLRSGFKESAKSKSTEIKMLGHKVKNSWSIVISASFSSAPVAFAAALLSSVTEAQLHLGVR